MNTKTRGVVLMVVGAIFVIVGYIAMGGTLEGRGDIISAYIENPIGWLVLLGLGSIAVGLFTYLRKANPDILPPTESK